MKIFLYSRPEIEFADDELKTIFDSIAANGLEYAVNAAFAGKLNAQGLVSVPDSNQYTEVNASDEGVMVSYGGDGTFLEAVRLLKTNPMPVLGINFGHLGFLANVPKDEIGNAFRQLKENKFQRQKRSLLHIEGDMDVQPEYPYAFNEFSVHRDGPGMTTVEVSIDGERMARYYGDGVMISTPSGSTAYSLSVGGPIMAPDCECFVISPIAPHNLTMRPLVVPDSSEVVFKLAGRPATALISIDNQSFIADNGASFRIRKAAKSIFLANLQNISFYDTLRNKMMWGIDGRDQQK